MLDYCLCVIAYMLDPPGHTLRLRSSLMEKMLDVEWSEKFSFTLEIAE